MIAPSRRGFITGLVSFIAAPAIVRAESLMPVKAEREFMSAIDIVNTALRHTIEIGEVYGRSPAMMAIPDLLFMQRYRGIGVRIVDGVLDLPVQRGAEHFPPEQQ